MSVVGEAPDESWRPPPTVWQWGQGIPLEAVRFAGANRLCVDLGYNGSIRRVEPYSLRRTRAGHILLYARKVATGEDRAYRVDRIQSVTVTTQPFVPKYVVEFTPVGNFVVPNLSRTKSPRVGSAYRPSRKRINSLGPTYVIQCNYCSKKFRRKTRATQLRKHKDSYGYATCPGSGRHGYLVNVEY